MRGSCRPSCASAMLDSALPRLVIADEGDAALAQAGPSLAARFFERPPASCSCAALSEARDPVLLVGTPRPPSMPLWRRAGLPPRPASWGRAARRRCGPCAPTLAAARSRWCRRATLRRLAALERPLPHYGGQSWLLAEGSRALERGVWEAQGRPWRWRCAEACRPLDARARLPADHRGGERRRIERMTIMHHRVRACSIRPTPSIALLSPGRRLSRCAPACARSGERSRLLGALASVAFGDRFRWRVCRLPAAVAYRGRIEGRFAGDFRSAHRRAGAGHGRGRLSRCPARVRHADLGLHGRPGRRRARGRRACHARSSWAEVLARVENQYGVDAATVVAVWGVESNFRAQFR
jgi:hypothetical protein